MLREAPTEGDRLAWFGALLASESKLGSRLVIVGGSAIQIYLTSELYISEDIDIVGRKEAVTPVLKKWGFRARTGGDRRAYWYKEGVGLVDLVATVEKAGLPSRPLPTPHGDVQPAPVEALIVRRLVRAGREKSEDLFRQAEALAVAWGRGLDWDYMRAEAGYEKVGPLLSKLRRQVSKRS